MKWRQWAYQTISSPAYGRGVDDIVHNVDVPTRNTVVRPRFLLDSLDGVFTVPPSVRIKRILVREKRMESQSLVCIMPKWVEYPWKLGNGQHVLLHISIESKHESIAVSKTRHLISCVELRGVIEGIFDPSERV